jgi:hypothetical protein
MVPLDIADTSDASITLALAAGSVFTHRYLTRQPLARPSRRRPAQSAAAS